ncbi:MAG: prepilin-type N-terminal cleavage/methylation domain-containing protein, partial [Firmicutes bacterium]|nr:prepilin-type N-terminal cleavage/methylation domain-containing protein [Bacillota bacterium]
MKRKRGFTLIELLAVIVILAIIALIAVPVITNIIEYARREAFRDSAYGIIEAGNLYFTENLLS